MREKESVKMNLLCCNFDHVQIKKRKKILEDFTDIKTELHITSYYRRVPIEIIFESKSRYCL